MGQGGIVDAGLSTVGQAKMSNRAPLRREGGIALGVSQERAILLRYEGREVSHRGSHAIPIFSWSAIRMDATIFVTLTKRQC